MALPSMFDDLEVIDSVVRLASRFPHNHTTMRVPMKLLLFSTSRWFMPLLIALVTILIYLPGLNGDFEFDDAANILDNTALKIETLSRESLLKAALSGKSGPLGRSISMISFAANYYSTEFEPFFFKLTNVVIHLLAGVGVYAFVRQLTLALDARAESLHRPSHAHIVALTTVGIWLIHPLNLTSVLYVVQRMTSLAALFTFFALALYVLGRRKTLEGNQAKGILLIVIALGPMTALAVLSKENGALTPYLMLLVELVVFRFAAAQSRTRNFIYILFATIVLVPAVLASVNFERLTSYVANGYLQREFSLLDRLLTQPRVLMFYLRLLLVPNAGVMGIYHDDFPISSSLTPSFVTFFSVGAVIGLLAVAIFSIRKAPALAIGVLWFFLGHSVESTFLALEMVHEHRNYLPIVGPIFAAAYYFWRWDFNALAERAKWSIVLVVLAVFSGVTLVRSEQWSNLVDHAAIEVYNHPKSDRANYAMGRIYFLLYNNHTNLETARLADQYFSRAAASGSNSIFALTARMQMAYKARLESDPAWVKEAIRRLQFARPWAPNMVALNNLVNCQMMHYCKLADNDMTALLYAALANPDASPAMKGTAHSLLGGYYAIKLQNLEVGIPHIKAAVEADPTQIEYRLDLMRLHEASNNLVAASADLAAARKLDTWGFQKARLDAEKALLDSALKASTN